MTTEHKTLTLQQQLEAFQSKSASAPIAIAATKVVQDLIASGLADRSIRRLPTVLTAKGTGITPIYRAVSFWFGFQWTNAR